MNEMHMTAKLAALYKKDGTISETRLRRTLWPNIKGRYRSCRISEIPIATDIPKNEWKWFMQALLGVDDVFVVGWKYDARATCEQHAIRCTRFILDKMKEKDNGTR